MSLATKLETLKNNLKENIESKFNTTCSSNTIKALISELDDLISDYYTDPTSVLAPDYNNITTISEKIIVTAGYLCDVLNRTNVTSNIDDGFTTLINKVNSIDLKTTPNINLVSNYSSRSSGNSVTLTATITGDNVRGTPTGAVEFYDGNSSTPFATISTTSNTTSNSATFKTTRSKNVSSNTTYTFYAKYISTNELYNATGKSSGVNVTWTYTAPSPTWTDDNVSASLNTTSITYGQSVKITASGTGSLKIGTSSGGNNITTLSSSGSYSWTPSSAGTYTVYVTSEGNSSSYIRGKTVTAGTVTVSQATGSTNLTIPSVKATQTVTISATGQGKVTIGTTDGGTQISSGGNNNTTGSWTPTNAGNYTIYANSAGNSNYTSSSTSKTITVAYMGTNITSTMTVLDQGNEFVAYLKDDDGNPIKGRPVNVQISGNNTSTTKEVTTTTDTTGAIRVTPDTSVSWGGRVTFSMSFGRVTNLYNSSSNTFTVTYRAFT